jgi:hypothetical protein
MRVLDMAVQRAQTGDAPSHSKCSRRYVRQASDAGLSGVRMRKDSLFVL